MKPSSFVGVFLMLSVLIAPSGYAKLVQLTGKPVAKASCDENGCVHEKIAPEEQDEYGMEVVRFRDDFYWTSQDDKRLFHYAEGASKYYVNPEGSGYVKTVVVDGKCTYMEHLTTELKNITYWGECQESQGREA